MQNLIIRDNLSLENTPSYLLLLGEAICRIEQHVSSPTVSTGIEKPMDVNEAAAFLLLEVPTLYTHVQKRTVPFHKRGKKLYFFREELVQWIKTGESTTHNQTLADAEEKFLSANKRKGGSI